MARIRAKLSDRSNLKPSPLLPFIRSSPVDSLSHNITTTGSIDAFDRYPDVAEIWPHTGVTFLIISQYYGDLKGEELRTNEGSVW